MISCLFLSLPIYGLEISKYLYNYRRVDNVLLPTHKYTYDFHTNLMCENRVYILRIDRYYFVLIVSKVERRAAGMCKIFK